MRAASVRLECLLPLALGIAVILGGCNTAPEAGLQPVQSPNDSLRYRHVTLDNSLRVLLISDPDTPKAAAALDVMVGSGDNPEGRGGLAHFLEHMLFLGTDKYPDPAEYERFLTEHGGNRNAYTSFEHTNYFFDVNAAYLPEALDRFAQFFIAPRFDADYVQREKNAVQAEYQMGLKSDVRRGLDVLQEIMNPAHPFSQFAVGSLDSLADRPDAPVRDDLLAFYQRYYSANLMRLVVLGSQSLDELEALVAPMFSQVPDKSASHDPIEPPLFEPDSLPLQVNIKPQATQRQLQVSFPVDDYRAEYRAKPVSYLGNLVGHEGAGSLFSQLKAEGLAEGLSAGPGLAWRGGSLFTVTVSLTSAGVADYQRVLQLLFAYLDMLRAEGPQAWLYDEQSRLAELSFRFKENSDPIGYVTALASGMQYYEPADVLRGPYMMDEFRVSAIESLLQDMVPGNAVVILSDSGLATDRQSRQYGVPYARRVPDSGELAGWKAASGVGDLHLPAPNEFIADDVSLVPLVEGNPEVPAVAFRNERLTIWFRQAEEFRLPRGATYINFRSPQVGQHARQTAAAVLYTALLTDSVNEFAYPALLAGLNFSLYKHAQGLSLRVSGYTDKQPLLLQRILTAANSEFDPKRFENIRRDMIRSLRNAVAKRPGSQVMDDLREALMYGEWGEAALIDALENLDRTALADYARAFWQGVTSEAMIYGNYSTRGSRRIVRGNWIGPAVGQPDRRTCPRLRVLKLAAGESLQYAVEIPHDDSVVAWYLQGGGDSWEDRAGTALAAQVVKSGFFQQLRTEQQLGYVVNAFAWPRLDIPGLVLLIQSPSHSAPQVADAMQLFMEAVPGSLDADQFERHRSAVVQEIRRPDKNLWERAEFYWQSIARKQFRFDGRESLASAVEGYDLAGWKAYFDRVFLDQRHSLQVVAPGRWGELPQAEGPPYRSADAIKRGHATYLIE